MSQYQSPQADPPVAGHQPRRETWLKIQCRRHVLARLQRDNQLATFGSAHQINRALTNLSQRIYQLTLGKIDYSPAVEARSKFNTRWLELTLPVTRHLIRQCFSAVFIQRHQLGQLMCRTVSPEASQAQPTGSTGQPKPA